jgi:hypothetical protein
VEQDEMTILTVSTDNNVPLQLLDQDIAASATARSNVFAVGEGTPACAIELRVTLLGAPANLVARVRGQATAPAGEASVLLPVSVAVPDLSALSASYTGVFVVPAFAPWMQLELQHVSGGNVHVTAHVLGSDAEFASSSALQLAAGAAVALTGAALTALTDLASTIASGSLKAVLQAGANAIGKLAANASGVLIGQIEVAANQSIQTPPASSLFDVTEKSDLGTSAFQLANQACAIGAEVTNTSTNGNLVYVGSANVSPTRFIRRIYPGEPTAFFPVANTNLLYVYGSAASTKLTYGGF